MEELKPCPFCGTIPKLFSIQNEDANKLSPLKWIVRCQRCGANQLPFGSDHDAVEAWNRRVIDD